MLTSRTLMAATFLAASALAGGSAAQTAKPATLADMKPDQPGGLVLFTGTPWNDLGAKQPLATVEGVSDGRLEVLTVAAVDPQTGATAVRRVVSNTPIPDSLESRIRFGGPQSASGKQTVPTPGAVQKRR